MVVPIPGMTFMFKEGRQGPEPQQQDNKYFPNMLMSHWPELGVWPPLAMSEAAGEAGEIFRNI